MCIANTKIAYNKGQLARILTMYLKPPELEEKFSQLPHQPIVYLDVHTRAIKST